MNSVIPVISGIPLLDRLDRTEIIEKLIQKLGLKAYLSIVLIPVSALIIGKWLFSNRNKSIQSKAVTFADINILPTEILLQIFGLLKERDLGRTCCVRKCWRDLVNQDDGLWKDLYRNNWPTKTPQESSLSSKELFHVEAEKEARRLSFHPYRYIIAIVDLNYRNSISSGKNWRSKFLDEINETSAEFVLKNGEMLKDSNHFGLYRFIEREDAIKKFSSSINESYDCPYITKVLGYFNFEFARDKDLDEWSDVYNECIRSFAYEAGGFITRIDTKASYPSIHLVELSFKEAFSRQGIADGDALLTSDANSSYIREILTESQETIRKAGKKGKTCLINTHTHNPLRLDGEAEKEAEELSELSVSIWVHNLSIINNSQLFPWSPSY